MIEHINKIVLPSSALTSKMEQGSSIRMYLDGAPFSGIERVHKPNGEPKGDYQYFLGYNNGLAWIYNPDGSLNHIAGWYHEQPHGIWRFYDDAGNLIKDEVNFIGTRLASDTVDKNGLRTPFFRIRKESSDYTLYERRLQVATQREHLIPSIDLPLEEAFDQWEKAVLQRIAEGKNW